MLGLANCAALRSRLAARRALLALALATAVAQLLLPLAHLGQHRRASHEANALVCVGAGPGVQHLHAGSPGEALPHDANHCAACAATAQARATLADAAAPAIVAPATVLPLTAHASRARIAVASRRCAPPRAPPSLLVTV